MSGRSNESDYSVRYSRGSLEKVELQRLAIRSLNSMKLIRGSVLISIIVSLLFGLLAWAALADPSEEMRRRMLPLGIALALISANLMAYAFWARSAWRKKRDELRQLVSGRAPGNSRVPWFRVGNRRRLPMHLARPIGVFSSILFIMKLYGLYSLRDRLQASNPSEAAQAVPILLILSGVIFAVWLFAELVDRFSNSLPY